MIIHVSFFDLQELLLLEEDVKALEEMYPQGEQVTHENWLDIIQSVGIF